MAWLCKSTLISACFLQVLPLPEILPGMQFKAQITEPGSSSVEKAGGSGEESVRHQEVNLHLEGAPKDMEPENKAEEELLARKQKLLHAVDSMRSQNPAGTAGTDTEAQARHVHYSSQNGHSKPCGLDTAARNVEASSDTQAPPPPPPGSPGRPKAPSDISADTLEETADLQQTLAEAASEQTFAAAARAAVERAGETTLEDAGRRGRRRTPQEAAAWKEEQQELALERAIQEIHWRQAADEVGYDEEPYNEGEEEGDKEVEEGELAEEGTAVAMAQPTAAAAGEAAAWAQDLPHFFQDWGRQATSGAAGSAAAAGAANHAAAQGAASDAHASAWDAWHQQGPGWHNAEGQPSSGAGAAPADKAAEDQWQQWQAWQQQQQSGAAGIGPSGSSWDAAGAYGFPWTAHAQGTGKEGMVSVPVALVQRYQMLEWAEWCRQYERWREGYEQWYSWWSSQMWQYSGYYTADTNQGAATG